MNILTYFQQALFPPFCSYCKEFLSIDTILCSSCFERIKPIVTYPLQITKTYEVPVFSVGSYQDPLRALIKAKHYRQRKTSYELGRLLWNMTNLQYQHFDIIVPIPLHWTRYAWRWFNQSEEIAKVVAQKSSKPLVNLLKRTRKTKFQTGLSRKERIQNVADVFTLTENAQDYKNKRIVLVDDVLTTGTTLKEAIKQVRRLRPASIIVAVVARVL